MTDKREAFCQYYNIHGNATKAATESGYSKKTAYSSGHRLLKKAEVKERLAELREERSLLAKVTITGIIEEYARIAFSDVKEIYDDNKQLKRVDDLDSDTSRAIASIKVRKVTDSDGEVYYVDEYKFYDKLKALEKLKEYIGNPTEESQEEQKEDYSQINIKIV